MEAAYFKRALTTGRRVRERAMDGLEAFRVNRLRREADLDISDKGGRLCESDPSCKPILARGYRKLVQLEIIATDASTVSAGQALRACPASAPGAT